MGRRDGEAVNYLTSALVASGAVAACVGPTDRRRSRPNVASEGLW